MSAVDVLGAMDDAADDLDSFRMHSATLREARAAVAELIERERVMRDALIAIATGSGYYGQQAREYKAIASAALAKCGVKP